MSLELRQLDLFVTLARERHFSRAAALLGITQPALSQQVMQLERDLGLRLFDRSSRAVELSCEGRDLLGLAAGVLAAADDLGACARRRRLAPAGDARGADPQLRVAHPGGVLGRVAAQVGASLAPHCAGGVGRDRLPAGDLLDAVLTGRVDAAVVADPPAGPLLRASDPLWVEEHVLLVGRGHRLAVRPWVDVAEVDEERGRPFDCTDLFREVDELRVDALTRGAVAVLPASSAGCQVPDLAVVPVTGSPPCAARLVWHADLPEQLARSLRRAAEETAEEAAGPLAVADRASWRPGPGADLLGGPDDVGAVA